MKTIIIKELNIEVETKIHNKNKTLNEIKIPDGWRLLTVSEIIFLTNKYKKELNLEKTWEFIEQPFKINKEKNYVARFYAYSDVAYLFAIWDSTYSDRALGVRFCRDIGENKK